jgi:hypothetical protein
MTMHVRYVCRDEVVIDRFGTFNTSVGSSCGDSIGINAKIFLRARRDPPGRLVFGVASIVILAEVANDDASETVKTFGSTTPITSNSF